MQAMPAQKTIISQSTVVRSVPAFSAAARGSELNCGASKGFSDGGNPDIVSAPWDVEWILPFGRRVELSRGYEAIASRAARRLPLEHTSR